VTGRSVNSRQDGVVRIASESSTEMF
jgi:hypothetical protein